MTAEEWREQNRWSDGTTATFFISPALDDSCECCGEPSTAIVYGVTYCYPHGYQAFHVKLYIEPTEEEQRYAVAQFRAMCDMVECSMQSPLIVMDRPWMEEYMRLVDQYLRPN